MRVVEVAEEKERLEGFGDADDDGGSVDVVQVGFGGGGIVQ